VGWLGVVAGFIILSYYIVVAGWAMDFTLKSVVNVAKPIHDQAEVEATKYRATVDLEAMRQTLIEHKAEREVKADITNIRAQAKPSDWQAYERYTAALQAAGVHRLYTSSIEAARINGLEQPEFDQRFLEVHRRLTEDETFAAQVETAQQLVIEIEDVQDSALSDAEAHFAQMSPQNIRDEAEDLYRRGIIFEQVQEAFTSVATDGWTSAFWSALFMLITILIVASGISSGGIERACRTPHAACSSSSSS
jgi:hypothetical protein